MDRGRRSRRLISGPSPRRAVALLLLLTGSAGLVAWAVGPEARGKVGIAERSSRSTDSGSTRRADPALVEVAGSDVQEPVAGQAGERSGEQAALARPRPSAAPSDADADAVQLRALVTDEDGLPMPGVRVRLERLIAGELRPRGSENTAVAESDANGALAIDEPLACGTWAVRVPAALELIEPTGPLEIEAGAEIQHATLVVRAPDPMTLICGRVLDALGDPVPGVKVRASDESAQPAGAGETNERGEFRVARQGAAPGPVHLRVERAAGFDDLAEPWTYDWGSVGVVLTMQRASHVRLTVVEEGTARPVEDFGVSWFQVDDSGRCLHGSQGALASHARGEADVEGVPRGKIRIVVTPASTALAPSDPVELWNGPRQAEMRIELKRRTALHVRVTFGDGRAAAGTELELMQPEPGERIELSTYGLESERHARLGRADSYALLLDSATTDGAGQAVLHWPASGTPLAIRVRGAGHLPLVEHGVIAHEDGPAIEITVSAGATLSGVVRPLSVVQALARGQLENDSGTQGPTIVLTYLANHEGSGFHARRTTRVDRAGEFRLTGLAPGTWGVMFRDQSFDPNRTSNLTVRHFAPVVLGADSHLRVEYDIDDLAPASLGGQVLLDGNPVANRRIELVRVSRTDELSYVQAGSSALVADSAGDFLAEGIQPGRYHVAIPALVGDGRQQGRLMCAEGVDVAPGSSASRVFRIQSGTLEIRLTDDSGEPVARRHFVVKGELSGFRITGESDADGVLRCDPIGAGRYTVSIQRPALDGDDSGGVLSLGEVTVAGGPIASQFAMTVPGD